MTLARLLPALVVCAVSLVPAEPRAAQAFRFSLRDTAGVTHTERDWTGARAVVFVFITPDCPISQGYVPELNRLAQEYGRRGVRLYAVQADTAASQDDVRRHVEAYGYGFPVLDDPGQYLVSHTGAGISPESVVMTTDGRVRYRGRIDDRIVSLGSRRPQATEHTLRKALDAVLGGRPVAIAKTTAFGCIIPRRS